MYSTSYKRGCGYKLCTENGTTALMNAVIDYEEEEYLVQTGTLLLEKGAYPNIKDDDGKQHCI